MTAPARWSTWGSEPLFRQIEEQIIVRDQLGVTLTREGNRRPGTPMLNLYKTADGKHFSVAGGGPCDTTQACLNAVGLADDPRFAGGWDDVTAHREEFEQLMSEWMRARTVDEADAIFAAAGAVGAPVLDADDMLHHPQLLAREMIIEVADDELGTVRMPGIVPKLTRTPGRVLYAGQPVRSANRDVFARLSAAQRSEIDELEREGVISPQRKITAVSTKGVFVRSIRKRKQGHLGNEENVEDTTDHQHLAIVSADGHCGANILDYKPYLASRYHDEFDTWAYGEVLDELRANGALSAATRRGAGPDRVRPHRGLRRRHRRLVRRRRPRGATRCRPPCTSPSSVPRTCATARTPTRSAPATGPWAAPAAGGTTPSSTAARSSPT